MTAGSDADNDVDVLLRQALAHADRMLKGNEPFFPFGFGMTPDGQLDLQQTASVDPAVNAPQLVEMLWSGYRDAAAQARIIACAVAYDANIGDGPQARDAVAVTIEHQKASRKTFFVPYRKRRFRGLTYDFSDRFAQDEEGRIF